MTQSKITRYNVEFNAEDVTLRGWFYKAETALERAPAIVMAHGYNCIKELYLDKYAEIFVAAGFNVLVYDHRNFGESDGEPRQELDPWQQVRDYRHAISFVQELPEVDPDKIGIWGTSYSGGHVLVVAAIDNRVKCVVSQVPTISGWRSMQRRIRPGEWADLRKNFNEDRRRRFQGKEPMTVPMVTLEKESSSHASLDAWNFFTGVTAKQEDLWRYETWRNRVTLRSLEMYSEYEPGSYITRIAPTPLLMIVAKNDVVTLTDEELTAYNQANEPKKLILIEGGHFSPYIEQFEASANPARDWYIEHLHK